MLVAIGLLSVAIDFSCSADHLESTAATTSASAPGILQGHLYGVGGPPPGIQEPWPGTVTLSGVGTPRDLPVGPDGAFSVTAAPGRYTVMGHSPRFESGTRECLAANEVQVTAGVTITVDVLCHMR